MECGLLLEYKKEWQDDMGKKTKNFDSCKWLSKFKKAKW